MSSSSRRLSLTLDEVLRAVEGGTRAGPAASAAIEAAEKALDVSFPSDYRAFLSDAGAFFGLGCEIAGIVTAVDDAQPPLWIDVVSWNRQLRRRQKMPIPAAYIAIASDGGDHRYYIDTTRRDERGRSPVVVIGPGADYETVAGDFFEFVMQEIDASASHPSRA